VSARACFVVCFLLAACAATPARPDGPLITEDDDPAARAAALATPPTAPEPARLPPLRSSAIARATLDAVLDAGPGAFLRGVQVDAELMDRRLRGWRIRRFWPGDPRFARVDLAPGDLVLSVNGRLIVRPEHLQRVWDSLHEANQLVVEVERAGSVYKLEYTIVDSLAPPGSNPGP